MDDDGDDKRHRFWDLRSPSRAAAIAYSRPKPRPMGFARPTGSKPGKL